MLQATRFFLLFFLVIAPVFPASAIDSAPEDFIISRDGVGFITTATTEEELRKTLPANQIKNGTCYECEAEDNANECSSEIFPDSPKNAFIVWEMDKNANSSDFSKCFIPPESKAVRVYITKMGVSWHTQNGIHVGMNLDQLEKANGAPVTVSICECDTGGEVLSWNNGTFSSNIHMRINVFGTKNKPEPRSTFDTLQKNITLPVHGVLSSTFPEEIKKRVPITQISVDFREK